MKKTTFLAALLTIIGAGCTMAETAQDTTFVVNDKQIVVNEKDGATTVGVYNDKGNELKKISETTYVDGQEVSQIYVSSPFLRSSWERSKRKKFEAHNATLYFGYRYLTSDAFSFSADKSLYTKNSNSYEIGIGALNVAIPFNRQNNIGLAIGMQVGYTRHAFDSGHALFMEDDVATVKPVEAEERIRKSYMSYWSMRIPVMLEYQQYLGRRDAFIGAGFSFEFRDKEHARYKTKHDTFNSARDLSIHTAGVNFEAYMGCGDFMFRFTTGLTPLFKGGQGPKAHTSSIGIGFCL